MNRERLKYRKFLRDVAWLAGAVGLVLLLFDWLLWQLLFPAGPSWLRIVGDLAGFALVLASVRIMSHVRTLGRRARADGAGE